ncbi:MAG: hypothetical protein J07HQX50_01394 [Haloquadratum sp. J07HQX50]|nr:MAG: hypothetical protein J07HQX50_01394 [Haloquadratum sp. J07HQX50]
MSGAHWEWDEHDWILGSFEERSCSPETSVSKPARSQRGQSVCLDYPQIPRLQSREGVNLYGWLQP